MARVGRWLVSAFLVLHLLSALAYISHEIPPGKALRKLTRPYENLVGARQSWAMFAPNPPSDSRRLEVQVLSLNGRWELLEEAAPGDPGPVRWHYRRMSKLERNLVKPGNQALRQKIARRICARAVDEGERIAGVSFVKIRTPVPSPAQARQGARGEEERKELDRFWCEA